MDTKEFHRSGARKMKSRWGKGGVRYSPSIKVEDGRWVKARTGWRYKTDQCTQEEWVFRRHESYGWFRGARIAANAPAMILIGVA